MPVARAVIPAAGIGTRLYPMTKSQPREMLPLGRKPALHVVVEELIDAGITEICIITGKHQRAIEDHFDLTNTESAGPLGAAMFPAALREGKVHIYYVRQPEPRGVGDALLQAEGFVGEEPFVVALGDVVITGPAGAGALVRRMIDVMDHTDCDAVLGVRHVPRSQISSYDIVKPFGSVEGKPHFMVEDVVQRPPVGDAPSDIALAGRYHLRPIIFDYLRHAPIGPGGELSLSEALRRLIHDREAVWAAKMKPGERRFDVGSFLQYSRAFIHFSLEDPEVGLSVREYIEGLMGN
ncbi:MAG: UTP--glucose-1-phosphate uridylyltransferase [Armatimonadota bacterium]